jgi:coenzyme F420-reducing hydrogenase gamma subunit
MKPKVAFFDFASCEGCQLTVINLEDEILDILSKVDIVNFREAISERGEDYDVAFIEGSITREHDRERLEDIRRKAKIVVALGACAATGGLNALKNLKPISWIKERVYGKDAGYYETLEKAYPIDKFVKVDYYVWGCPIDKKEFMEVFKSILLGKKPQIPDYPLCVECRLKENVCVFEKGLTCLGPITRAGCGAICPQNGNSCEGCRGFIENPEVNAEKQILEKYGKSVDEILTDLNIFNAYREDELK